MQTTRIIRLDQVFGRRGFSLLTTRNALASRPLLRAQLGGARGVIIKSIPASAQSDTLNAQRLLRPSSPHFTIYEPQITWLASIANRITGAGLSVLLYGFSIGYLIGPVIGVPIDSAHIVELAHSLPEWAKVTGKTILAAPFAFHSLNGIRHLSWDSAKLMSVKAVTRSGYAVLAASAVSTVYLVMM
ncbi:cytochrome b subunit of succinate dehydrogenase, Sdh3p [Tulasnella sp. JGI-2019a]|nr:cytochrome b subunit of succinate dehydrogenase, Sdh3p [Tulasnella sp. JGI-2019a]KAG9034935.1 cytochrome b subunit of succinate dehydrogenase, Sdh3p [Tulasnella sp. JGI-2019a]